MARRLCKTPDQAPWPGPRSGQPHARPSFPWCLEQLSDSRGILLHPAGSLLSAHAQDLRLPHESPGTLCPICFLQFYLQPLLSEYPANCSFIHPCNTHFIEYLLCSRHCPRCRSEPNRQNPASMELTLWRVEFPFRHELSFLCLQLPFPHLAGPFPPANLSSPFQRYPSWEQCHNSGGTSQHCPSDPP